MKLIDFINSTFDWKTQLHEKNIKISGLDDFYLLKYGHVADFSDELVCQCRGVIIKHQEEDYKIVCLPFDKFMNYGQEGAANIDWDSALNEILGYCLQALQLLGSYAEWGEVDGAIKLVIDLTWGYFLGAYESEASHELDMG